MGETLKHPNPHLRWGIIFIVILLISLTCLPNVFAKTMNRQSSSSCLDGDILYVGGDGPGNYTRIQDAIDNASQGYTVFVYDDSSPYYENLVINKSISLIGENKETTIIDGIGSNKIVLIRLATHVHLQGFTICNSSHSEFDWEYLKGVGITLLAATFCNISDMIFTDTDVGIHLLNYIWNHFTHSNTLFQNAFRKNKIGVVLDWGSGYSTIMNNAFRRNWYGIVVITTNSNIIVKNNFLWNVRPVYLKPDVFWPEGDPMDEINHNSWSMNYWDRPRLFRILLGRARVVYDHASWFMWYFEVDLHPAQEPYDIDEMTI
jgi:parallel beta-helix repeat protein